MTLNDYQKLLEYINENHKFPNKGKAIKYIDTTVDMRTGEIFLVTLRRGSLSHNFRIYEKSDIDEIYKWLEG